MGWDVSLVISHDNSIYKIADCGSFTYEADDLLKELLGFHFSDLNVMKSSKVCSILKSVIEKMKNSNLDKYNIKSEGQLLIDWLSGIVDQCEINPDSVLDIN